MGLNLERTSNQFGKLGLFPLGLKILQGRDDMLDPHLDVDVSVIFHVGGSMLVDDRSWSFFGFSKPHISPSFTINNPSTIQFGHSMKVNVLYPRLRMKNQGALLHPTLWPLPEGCERSFEKNQRGVLLPVHHFSIGFGWFWDNVC